jgi:hypothetical protein
MTAASDTSRPTWASRLLATFCYLGLTPFLHLFRVRRDDAFLGHHRAQGPAAPLMLLLLLCMWPIYLSLETYLVRHHVGQASQYGAVQAGVMIVFLAGLGLCGLMTVVGMGTALAGSRRCLPLVNRLARRPRLMRVALAGNSILVVSVALVIGLALHASTLARADVVPAPVYFLYDNAGYEALGTWGPKLFCYRISRVAQQRWGPGKVVVAPITVENLRTAIEYGRFVVLASHGSSGEIHTVDDWAVFPAAFARPGKDLQFVYISACGGGQQATEWQQVFAPAEVVTFDRLSGGLEHLWWLWFEAPDQLRETR